MEKQPELIFDFQSYVQKLMEALHMERATPEVAASTKNEIESQLGLIITRTISTHLNPGDWQALQEELPKPTLNDIYLGALELRPDLESLLTRAVDDFFEETVEAYNAFKA